MPICIECRYPVPQLFHVLQSRNAKSAAPTPSNPSHKSSASSLAKYNVPPKTTLLSPSRPSPVGEAKATVSSDVRLTQCPRCKRFADKYVEHDYVVIFIDLVLIKPQVYRHILFNRFAHDAPVVDPTIRRLGILLLLFDVYLTMIYIESIQPPPVTPIADLNALFQWSFFLFVCFASTASQHLTIRCLASLAGLCGYKKASQAATPSVPTPSASGTTTPGGLVVVDPPKAPTPSSISTALFISSCMSLFPILMIVWMPDETATAPSPTPSSELNFLPTFLMTPGPGVGWVRKGVVYAILLQNLEALRILLGCGYLGAGALVLVGWGMRRVVRSVILGTVGLSER